MADVAEIWKSALPTVIHGVTGRGVWAALNAVRPITQDEDTFVVGLRHEDGELAGHLRLAPTQRLMEQALSSVVGKPVRVRVIDGVTLDDYEIAKRRDVERRRLQEAEMAKLRAEMQAKTSWDSVYEQLSRRFAAVPNKSLAQNRARFYEEAVEIVAEARRNQPTYDDLAERNFARCIERVAQYVEIPTTLVAVEILKRVGEL